MDFQGTLFAGPSDDCDLASTLADRVTRRDLSAGAWIDVARDWLAGYADEAFAALHTEVPWRAERRPMYDRLVAVPRLLHTYGAADRLPHPALAAARDALSAHYAAELGEPFTTAGCCYYRDGNDSVAWHGDTIGRGSTHDTMVAIVSFGDPRRLTCVRGVVVRPWRSRWATAIWW